MGIMHKMCMITYLQSGCGGDMGERERERIATRAAIIGILANLFLFIV